MAKKKRPTFGDMSLVVMEKLSRDYLIPGLIAQKKQEIEFLEKLLGRIKERLTKKEKRGKKKT